MIQFFRKVRANHYFKTRSADRNTETDHARVTSIFHSIERVRLRGAELRLNNAYLVGSESPSEIHPHR